MDKVVRTAADAVADIEDGSSLAVGGFGLCGVPSVLIHAVLDAGTTDLEVVSNNCGVDDWGLGMLLSAKRIRRMVASYVGENKEFARQYLEGELEVELTPQGTLAERLRAGGSGIPAFFTATGVGTQVADGGLPWRYRSDGSVALASPVKETRTFATAEGDRAYVLERAIVCDFGLVRAWKGDRHGNLVYRKSARNFNPLAAMSGRVTIAEVEELVEPGDLDPNQVHTPGVYVHRVVPLTPEQAAEKRIERVTVRPRQSRTEPDPTRVGAGPTRAEPDPTRAEPDPTRAEPVEALTARLRQAQPTSFARAEPDPTRAEPVEAPTARLRQAQPTSFARAEPVEAQGAPR